MPRSGPDSAILQSMARTRPGLWAEIAGALALLTLAVLVLNAGVFWLVLERTESQRRTDLAISLAGALQAQLEVASRAEDPEVGMRDVVHAYKTNRMGLSELFVVTPALEPVEVLLGEVPATPDPGLRAALFAKETHMQVRGSLLGERDVVVTAPVGRLGSPIAAVRVAMPLKGPGIPGGAWGFALIYALACGGVIALFGWARLRRVVVGPIQRVREGTKHIAEGGFGHALPDEPIQEIQDLVVALNEMSGSLAGYRKATAEQVHSLEEAYANLEEAQEALIRSERLAGIGRMAAGVAHEVGNPLAAVLGYVELLNQGGLPEETAQDMLKRTRTELQRIDRTIQSLLGYSRPGTGEDEPIAIGPLLQEACSTVQAQASLQGCSLSLAVAEGLQEVCLERDKLHQVLVNLLLNAIGAPSTEVRLSVHVVGDELEIQCEDDGPGVSAVALERAFEPFFTTKDVGQGTGLGLATCQQIISGAGGTIVLTNREQGGACATIRLPHSHQR
jgi:signal transduction histidine kinase